MKTHTILFIFIFFMHTLNLVNITLLNGEWNGIVLWVSSILFLLAIFFYGTEYQARKKRKASSENSHNY
jgi:hypothetical protein